jgi:hypothetical protein
VFDFENIFSQSPNLSWLEPQKKKLDYKKRMAIGW